MQKPRITGKGVQLIASHLKQSPSFISELSINDADIQRYENGLQHIAEALQTNCHLTKLILRYMDLNCSRENSSALTKMLNMNKTLTHLDLSYNRKFSDPGAHCIFQGLQQNKTLTHLNLRSNEITGYEGTAQALNKMLQVNKTLTHLNLSNNKIFSYSCSRCILEGLQHNTTLVHLNLDSTGLSATEDTTRALATILQVNTSLTHLILSRNFRLSSGIRPIFKTLQHNTTLVHLDLSWTGMGNYNVKSALNEMLKMNKTLAYLNLSDNGISDSDACSIFQALQHNSALVHLDLHGNNIYISYQIGNIEFVRRIAKFFESNTTLRELHLVYNRDETTVNEKVQAIHRIRQEKGLVLHPLNIFM